MGHPGLCVSVGSSRRRRYSRSRVVRLALLQSIVSMRLQYATAGRVCKTIIVSNYSRKHCQDRTMFHGAIIAIIMTSSMVLL